MAQLINLLVYIYLFLNIGVSARNIGFRLVVVIIADKVFYGVIGEEFLELGAELGGQGLVVADYQSRSLHPLNSISHDKGLTAAGNPQQCLVPVALI